MIRLTLIFSLFFGAYSSAQNSEFQVWTEAGLKGDIIKKMDWMVDVKARFGRDGLDQFLPEAGIDYKVKKWFKPSITYRAIIAENKYGNYKLAHRINLNANFKKQLDRFRVGARLRYQYAFERVGVQAEYDADFDQAIRFKPFVEYDINNSIFTPKISAELFYDPIYGPRGQRFTKLRIGIGSSFELDGPHSVSFKYQLDKWFYDYERGLRHVLALSYGYKL